MSGVGCQKLCLYGDSWKPTLVSLGSAYANIPKQMFDKTKSEVEKVDRIRDEPVHKSTILILEFILLRCRVTEKKNLHNFFSGSSLDACALDGEGRERRKKASFKPPGRFELCVC